MKILSIECSAVPCSAALLEDGKIIASSFVNVKLTHSQTLMPMVENMLSSANVDFSEIDGIAVSAGPGSFTGIRIGISAVKGLAAPRRLPCVGVSTLYAMAEGFRDTECIACAVMDARCNQVYNALFDITDGKITRLCEDRALMCEELATEIEEIAKKENKMVITVGDGTEIFYPFIKDIAGTVKSDIQRRFQNAVSVALAAEPDFINGKTTAPSELLPIYLRLPQAERELKLKRSKEK